MIKPFIALIAACFASVCLAQAPADPGHVIVPGMQDATPGDFNAGNVPLMWLGVKSCGVYVIWLVFPTHISVVDKDHHPTDMKEFMATLEHSKIPSDFRVILCTGETIN